MRSIVLSIAVLAVAASAAHAGPRVAHPQPTPSALSPEISADTPDDPLRTAAKARQDAFDERLAKKSERAMRSICVGCDAAVARTRPAGPKRVEAKAGTVDEADVDFVVDEPAEAPAY